MAVRFKTSNPTSLLANFNKKIDQEEPKGKITTWLRERHDNRDYYTHKAADWTKKAWFTPVIEDGALKFNIRPPKDKVVDVRTYAYYHGHLTETFLAHFDDQFTEAVSTAKAGSGDVISDKKE